MKKPQVLHALAVDIPELNAHNVFTALVDKSHIQKRANEGTETITVTTTPATHALESMGIKVGKRKGGFYVVDEKSLREQAFGGRQLGMDHALAKIPQQRVTQNTSEYDMSRFRM